MVSRLLTSVILMLPRGSEIRLNKKTVRLLGSRTVLVIFKSIFSVRRKLLSDTEFFLGDDGTVAVDVLADQVVEKTTTLTYQSLKSSCGRIIFMI